MSITDVALCLGVGIPDREDTDDDTQDMIRRRLEADARGLPPPQWAPPTLDEARAQAAHLNTLGIPMVGNG